MRFLILQEQQFNLINEEPNNNLYTITFEKKSGISLQGIKILLNLCYSYLSPIIIDNNGDPNFLQIRSNIDTEFWKVQSIEEKDNYFELILKYEAEPTSEEKIEILSAKLDYLAIMTDIDIEEV